MSGVPTAAWAANPKLFQSVEFLVTIGLLVLILLGGAVVLYITDVWRRKQLAPDRESADALTSYRTMFERGEITEAEYVAVRNRIAAQMRQEAGSDRLSGAEAAPKSRTGDEADPPDRPQEPPTG
jgi:hypothetical protein